MTHNGTGTIWMRFFVVENYSPLKIYIYFKLISHEIKKLEILNFFFQKKNMITYYVIHNLKKNALIIEITQVCWSIRTSLTKFLCKYLREKTYLAP